MRSTRPHLRSSTGFTLIELMVTIAVVAILSTIAVSTYTTQVRKSRRVEARQALLDLASREERFFSTNSAYTNSAANLGYSGAFPQPVGNSYYSVTVCVAAGPPCAGNAATGGIFLLTATAINTQASDTDCAFLSVDSTGTQNATTANCWK